MRTGAPFGHAGGHTRSVSSHHASLASTSSSLDELIRRVTTSADELSGGQDDAIAQDLYEVERSLRTAARRLASVVRRLPEGR
jgi:hypothetical protein